MRGWSCNILRRLRKTACLGTVVPYFTAACSREGLLDVEDVSMTLAPSHFAQPVTGFKLAYLSEPHDHGASGSPRCAGVLSLRSRQIHTNYVSKCLQLLHSTSLSSVRDSFYRYRFKLNSRDSFIRSKNQACLV